MKLHPKFSTPPKVVNIGVRDIIFKYVPSNAICAEIGVWIGYFSQFGILPLSQPKMLHLIDPYILIPGDVPRERDGKTQEGMDEIFQIVSARILKSYPNNITFHRKFSWDAVNDFDDEYFDWIYIDGDHSYNGVKKDLELYYPKVKHAGFITGDDYEPGRHNTVQRAVNEFIKSYPVKVKFMIGKKENSQFVLEKK